MDQDNNRTKLTRRRFFSFVANGSVLATLGGFAVVMFKYLTPNVLFEPPTKFKIGKPDDYPLDSVTFISDKKLFVVNRNDEYSVISAVCTHLGCTIKLTSNDEFHCPCHGSQFDKDGRIIKGPAQRPLSHYNMELSSDGLLEIDIKKEVESDYSISI